MRTIAHISDLHFGRTDQRIVEGLAADLARRSPSLLVVSGDLTQRARRRQYAAAASFLHRLPSPQLVVPGNHDIPLYDVVRRFFFPLERYRRQITDDFLPVFQDDEMIVLGINTARSFTFALNGFWKDGRISPEQLDDVRRRMCGLPETLFKVVVTHHPFIPPPNERVHGIVHGAAEALNVLVDCGVDLLLAGHLHMGYCGDVCTHHKAVKRSMLSVQAGSATSTRRRGEPNAYNWITLRPGGITLDVYAWDGQRFSLFATSQFTRADGIWRR
jgi:3',5'-cyclic AMP phosphodiesterase CpdA